VLVLFELLAHTSGFTSDACKFRDAITYG